MSASTMTAAAEETATPLRSVMSRGLPCRNTKLVPNRCSSGSARLRAAADASGRTVFARRSQVSPQAGHLSQGGWWWWCESDRARTQIAGFTTKNAAASKNPSITSTTARKRIVVLPIGNPHISVRNATQRTTPHAAAQAEPTPLWQLSADRSTGATAGTAAVVARATPLQPLPSTSVMLSIQRPCLLCSTILFYATACCEHRDRTSRSASPILRCESTQIPSVAMTRRRDFTLCYGMGRAPVQGLHVQLLPLRQHHHHPPPVSPVGGTRLRGTAPDDLEGILDLGGLPQLRRGS